MPNLGLRISLRMRFVLMAAAVLLPTTFTLAGGGPENVLLIIDSTHANALYLGHYYKAARNVIYMDPCATSFLAHTQTQLDALFGTLAHRGISDHIDYIVILDASCSLVPAAGYVSDACATVGSLSLSAVHVGVLG